MRGIKGDLLGFTFGDIHSSTLGITRTQEGLYNKSISPPHKDVILQMPKSDYTHYYGTTLDKRVISVNFVFEKLSDLQITRIKQVWNDKKVHNLIFDEEPYKVYSAKLTGVVTAKYVCFERNGSRYYNGNGSLSFECYFPYAKSRFSYLEDYNYNNISEWAMGEDIDKKMPLFGNPKKCVSVAHIHSPINNNVQIYANNESLPGFSKYDSDILFNTPAANVALADVNVHLWAEASGIPSRQQYGNLYFSEDKLQASIQLINPGDVNAILKVWLKIDYLDDGINSQSIDLEISESGNDNKSFAITGLQRLRKPGQTFSEDEYLCIDFYNQTIIGYKNIQGKMISNNTVYNRFLTGDFIIFPPNIHKEIVIKGNTDVSQLEPQFDITYLYL